MRNLWKAIIPAALAAAVAGGAGAAEYRPEGVVSLVSAGKAHTVEEGHFYFVGEFSGSYRDADPAYPLNDATVNCFGYNDIGVDAAGYCVWTDAAGDRAFASWTCGAGAPREGAPLGAQDCVGTWRGGTGKFAGASGSGPYVTVTLGFLPDGSAVLQSRFDGSAPTVIPD